VALGQAQVTISLEGWPEGRVAPSSYRLEVVPRKTLPAIKVSPEQQRVLTKDGYSIDEVRFSPDGQTLVVVMHRRVQGEHQFQFRLLDAATGKERGKIFQIDPEPLQSIYSPRLAFSKNSKLLAIHYNLLRYFKEGKNYRDEQSGQLHIFDLDTGRECWRHDGNGMGIGGAAFSPDSKTLVTGNDRCKKTGEGRNQKREFSGEVRFWDAATGKRKPNLPGGPYQIIWSIAYSPDGKYVVFQDEHRGENSQQYLGVWDLAAQKLRLKSMGQNQEAVFSPDGEKLAASICTWTRDANATYKKEIKVWDLAMGKQIASVSLPASKGWLSRPFWSADGKYLFFSSTLGELWRWDRVGSKSPVKVESIVQDSAGKQPLREAGSHDANVALGLFAFGVNSQLPKRITRRNLADDYDELPPPEIVLWT
jgi:dipeptidyl aminopeptidase/acylaminoacyl peptidase